jgi:hypothetical protein
LDLRGKKTRGRRKLQNEHHNLYSKSDIIRMIKPRRMRWVGACSTHGGNEKCIKKFCWSLKGRDHSDDSGIDGRISLKWILRKQGGRVWMDSSGLG